MLQLILGRYLCARCDATLSKRDVLMVAIAFTAAATVHYQQTTESGAFFVSNDSQLPPRATGVPALVAAHGRHHAEVTAAAAAPAATA